MDAIMKEKLPVIVFTFGFPWIPGSGSLRKTYVHVEVTPLAAVKKLLGLSGGKVKNGSIQKSTLKQGYKSNDPESMEWGAVLWFFLSVCNISFALAASASYTVYCYCWLNECVQQRIWDDSLAGPPTTMTTEGIIVMPKFHYFLLRKPCNGNARFMPWAWLLLLLRTHEHAFMGMRIGSCEWKLRLMPINIPELDSWAWTYHGYRHGVVIKSIFHV